MNDSFQIYNSQLIDNNGQEDLNQLIIETKSDVIIEDDILEISIFHPMRKDIVESMEFINSQMEGFKVKNGQIQLPNIGFIEVANLSIFEARDKIRNKFREEIHDIDVFISYKKRGSINIIELTGPVENSIIPIDKKISLYEVIAKAKISPKANLSESYILRDDIRLEVNLHKLIKEGDMSQNIWMKGNDKVFIADSKDYFVIVLGEVGFQRTVPLTSKYITVQEALAAAYGIPFTGDRQHIQVIRGELECPKIYTFSWDFMIHQLNINFLLFSGDVIYISRKPITEWNLFLKQLEGTINLIIAVDIIRHIK